MNILATGLEWFTHRPGGLGRYFMDFLNAWQDAGHEARALVNVRDESLQNDVPDYVRVHHLRGRHPLAVRAEWASVYKEETRGKRFDLFNPHFAYYAWAWDKLNHDMPVVTHFHGPWAYEVKAEAGSGPRRRLQSVLTFRMQKAIEKRVYKTSDQFIVLSRAFGLQLHEYYGIPENRIHVIPGAADTIKFHPATDREAVRHRLELPSNKFVLLSVRRLARRMGLENLITAMAGVSKEFSDVELAIVGGGKLEPNLRQMVSDLGLEHCIRVTGRVPDEDLPLYYQAADLMVVPSLSFEGFGLVTTEAMSCGTPVCGTPVGGTKEILEPFEKSLLFDGTSSDDIEAGLKHLL